LAGIIINGTLCALFFSEVSWVVKVGLFIGIAGITIVYSRRNLLGTTPFVFLTILSILFLPRVDATLAYIWLGILGTFATFYTLSHFVPAIFLLGIVITLMVSLYTAILTFVAYNSLDRFAFTVYLYFVYLLWYGWIREQPRLHGA
jgi:hypothetical protein